MENLFSTDLTLVIWRNIPFFIPLIVGVAVYVIDHYWHDDDKDIFVYVAALAIIGSVILLWPMWFSGDLAYFAGHAVSGFSLFALIIVLALALMLILTAHNYYQIRGASVARFVVFFLILVFGVISVLATQNLLIMFAGLSLVSVTIAFMLKSYGGGKPDISGKFWLYSVVADMLFCLGAVFYFGSTGRFDVASGEGLVGVINEVYTGNYFRLAISVMAVSLFVKVAAVPVHWWLLDVLRLRSLPLVSTIVVFYRAVMLLAALKIVAPLAPLWGGFFEIPFMAVAVLTMSWANISALKTHDLKELITYSSIAHVGYVIALFPALVVHGGGGLVAIVIMIVAFSLAHSGAFAAAQMLSDESGDRTDFACLNGLARSRPWPAVILSLFMMAMAGLPPLIGFLARFMAIKTIISGGSYFIMVVMAINMAVAIYCYSRPVARMYLFRCTEEPVSVVEIEYPLVIAIAASAVVTIYLGVVPASLIRWIQMSVSSL